LSDATCRVCEMTLQDFCATGSPGPKLCGLCRLMGPETLKRYLEIWAAKAEDDGPWTGMTDYDR
jgi:hypothetical protein